MVAIAVFACCGVPCLLNGQARRTLTVASVSNGGVAVTVAPADLNGASGATTEFSRQDTNGTVVTLTAPSTVGGDFFVKWKRNGVDYGTAPRTNVTLSHSRTMTAIYSATNQVRVNGSFENDFTAWTATGNAFIELIESYTPTDDTTTQAGDPFRLIVPNRLLIRER